MNGTKHEAYIAGVKFRQGGEQRLASIEDRTELTFELDPTNPHDPNAVKILHEGFHLGFVPRELSREVAEMIKDGRIGPCVKSRGTRIDIYFSESVS